MATQETPPTTSAWIHAPNGIARRTESDRLSAVQGKASTGRLGSTLTSNRRFGQSLQKDQRLRRKSEFLALRHNGVSRAHPLLVLRAVPNALHRTRFGFVVSKRVSVKAIDRNRVRRRLREIVRQAPIRVGWDQLLIARRPILDADSQTIRIVILDIERRLDLLEVPEADFDVNSAGGKSGESCEV